MGTKEEVKFYLGVGTPSSPQAGGIYVDSTNKCMYVKAKNKPLLSFDRTLPFLVKPTLQDYTWAEISKISHLGYASKFFRVGDIKKEETAGTSYTFTILGFDHDTVADSTQKAGITFGISSTSSSWITSYATTSSTISTSYKYSNSKIRSTLEHFESNPASTLNMLDYVVKVKKHQTVGNDTKEKLFTLSATEVGVPLSSVPEESTYTYFQEASNLEKYFTDDSATYWLRDFTYGSVYYLSKTGPECTSYDDSIRKILFGFCI